MGILARNPHEEGEEETSEESGEPVEPVGEIDLDDGVVLRAIDHIAIVVEDLDDAISDHRDLYNTYVEHREELHGEGAEIAFLDIGGSSVALIAPTDADSQYGQFLAEGGPGLHHIAYRVRDIDATLEALAEAGRELIDSEPVRGPRSSRVAFVHPDSAYGVLVQLVER